MAGLRHGVSITWGKGWSTGTSQVKGSAPAGASPRWSHTAPFPVAWSQIAARPHLSWPGPSQTFRQPNLQGGDEVLQGLVMHPGLAPLESEERNLPFLAAFPLHASSYLQDCLCLASPQHNTGFYRLS